MYLEECSHMFIDWFTIHQQYTNKISHESKGSRRNSAKLSLNRIPNKSLKFETEYHTFSQENKSSPGKI